MGTSLVTGPQLEPVSLAEVREHCRVTNSEFDAQLARHILTARRYAEGYMRRAILTQTWDYTVDWNWPLVTVAGMCRRRIELPLPPLQAVTSVSYVDPSGNTQTLATNQYVVRNDETIGYIDPAYGMTWPDVRFEPAAITVRFVTGWADAAVPDDVVTAIKFHAESLLDRDPASRELLESTRDHLLDFHRVVRIL